MARDGNGTYTRTDGTYSGSTLYQQRDANSDKIDADLMDAAANDIADALTESLAKDGQTDPTANLPMAGFKHTGAADSASLQDYVTVNQLQENAHLYAAASGTNTYTASLSPSQTTYVDGMKVTIYFANASTSTTPTLNLNSQGAKTIVKKDGTALLSGELDGVHDLVFNSAKDDFIVLNPAFTTSSVTVDDSTIEDNSGTLRVKANGIGTNEIAASAVTPTQTDFLENGNIDFMYGGLVASTGTATELPSGWSSAKNSTGNYTITHSLGNGNYFVIAAVYDSGLGTEQVIISGKTNNDFDILTTNAGGTSVDAQFSFMLVRYNT